VTKGIISSLPLEEIKDTIKIQGGLRPAARFYGVDHTTIADRLAIEGLCYQDLLFEYQQEIAPILTKRESIMGDAVIIADCHCPFVSLKWINRAVHIGKSLGITQLISAGDFFDFDRLSYWVRLTKAEDTAVPLGDELAFSEGVLETLESQFTTIHMIGGNHWKRLLTNITFSVSTDRLMGLVGRKYDPRYHHTGLFEWTLLDNKIRITHPAKSRKLDYTLARDLSILYPEQWMVVAHRHRSNEGFTPDGRPMWEIGWMGDTDRMKYVTYVDSTYYKWINGMAYYKNGAFRALTEYNYDWEEVDRELQV